MEDPKFSSKQRIDIKVAEKKQHMTANYLVGKNGSGPLAEWLDAICNDGGWELVQIGEPSIDGRMQIREAIFRRDRITVEAKAAVGVLGNES